MILKRAVISPNGINWSVILVEIDSASYEVGTEFFNIISLNLTLESATFIILISFSCEKISIYKTNK
jgi:hypothetical protein